MHMILISCLGVEGQTNVDNPHGFEVGSLVECPMADGPPRHGIIRWIGYLPQVKDKLVAGVELVGICVTCVFLYSNLNNMEQCKTI